LVLLDTIVRRPQTAEWIAIAGGALCRGRPRQPIATRRAIGASWHAETRAVLGSSANRGSLLVISAAAWLADVCCCYCALAALGVAVPFDVVLLAYTVGVLATLVPFVPAGFGLVETAMPLVLHSFGVTLGTAVAAVVVYRCVSTLLPAAVGLVCIPGLRGHRRQTTRVSAPLLLRSSAA
jgi:uncharacterized protein (TIRG00374 family)